MNDRLPLAPDEGPAYVAMDAKHFVAYQRWLRINGQMLIAMDVDKPPQIWTAVIHPDCVCEWEPAEPNGHCTVHAGHAQNEGTS